MDDVLQEVYDEDVPKVLEALEKDWPQHFLLHQYITIMQYYKKSNTKINQTLYRHGHIDDGVYLVKTSLKFGKDTAHNLYIYTPSQDLTDLSRVLLETSIIPWTSKDLQFEFTMQRFVPSILVAADAKGVSLSNRNKFKLFISPEDELDLKDVPDDMYLGFLDDHHVTEINSNWPFRFPSSDLYLSVQIRNNFGLGLFTKNEDKLMCSSLSTHSGGIFVLFTSPKVRGKGYAEIIVRSMVKELRKRGRRPFATIVLDNIPSINLFRKIGFKDFARVEFLGTS